MKENFRRMFRNVNPAVLIIILVLLVNNMLSSHRSLSDDAASLAAGNPDRSDLSRGGARLRLLLAG